jgi:hypothetical protein
MNQQGARVFTYATVLGALARHLCAHSNRVLYQSRTSRPMAHNSLKVRHTPNRGTHGNVREDD